MSKETLEWLQNNTLIGFTDKRPNGAWHHDADFTNHFPGAVPTEKVRELMSFPIVAASVRASYAIDGKPPITIKDDNKKAIVRADTQDIFGYFSGSYQIHQPEEWLIDNLNLILDGGLEVSTAGLLAGGRKVWVQAEVPETFTTAEGVAFRPYITAATSHDGTMATQYLTGATVVVCDNTLAVGVAQAASKVKIRHSANSLSRVGDIRDNLGLVIAQVADEFDAQVKALTSEVVSEDRWQAFLNAYNPIPEVTEGPRGSRGYTMATNKRAALESLWSEDERVAPWAGSAYGVLAAVNTYAHHVQATKGETSREERNFARMASGEFDKLDAETLKVLATV